MTCCFTGNRPAHFPWGGDETDLRCIRLKSEIKSAIEQLVEKGYTRFISGMAQGADTFCAEAVLEIKGSRPFIVLECALPCPEQTKGWERSAVQRYNNILDRADKITTVSPYYTRYCMMKRNAYMVDNADLVLAVWDAKESGGTFNTVQKARRDGKKLQIVGY